MTSNINRAKSLSLITFAKEQEMNKAMRASALTAAAEARIRKEANNLNKAMRASALTAAAEARIRKEANNLNKAMRASVKNEEERKRAVSLKVRFWKFTQKLLAVFMKSGDVRIMRLIKSLLRVYMTTKVNAPKPKVNANLARYRVQNAGGGGDCFYLSLRLAAGLTDTVQEMRNKIVAKILSNWNSNRVKTIYLNGKNYSYTNRREYANKMKGKCWAGHDEIEAASHVYKRNITIVTGTNSMATYPMEQNHPEWPRVYIRANATSANHEANVRMSHFQAYVRR